MPRLRNRAGLRVPQRLRDEEVLEDGPERKEETRVNYDIDIQVETHLKTISCLLINFTENLPVALWRNCIKKITTNSDSTASNQSILLDYNVMQFTPIFNQYFQYFSVLFFHSKVRYSAFSVNFRGGYGGVKKAQLNSFIVKIAKNTPNLQICKFSPLGVN